MKKKTVLVLLSLLHICVFLIGILIILHDRAPKQFNSVSSTLVVVAEPESESMVEVPLSSEPETETLVEVPILSEEDASEETSAEESPSEEASAPLPSYTFAYVRGRRNLNIRNGPSMQASIIGKIPPGKGGVILEFANEDWALIEYRGTTGYSSLHWMELTPVSAEETAETEENKPRSEP